LYIGTKKHIAFFSIGSEDKVARAWGWRPWTTKPQDEWWASSNSCYCTYCCCCYGQLCFNILL